MSDLAVTTTTLDVFTGEAMAMGERTPAALIDAPASSRMAVGEAITNIACAPGSKNCPTCACPPTGCALPVIPAKIRPCSTR
ncbi:MAG: hypothetical protein R3F38_10665 [Gammaproteobacteria bacterium]